MTDDVSIVRTAAGALTLWGGCAALLRAGLDLHAAGWSSVDSMVGLLVVALGCVAAAVMATGLTALGVATAARRAGRSARVLTRVAHRLTPTVLRRAVSLGLGAGLSFTGVTAAAADDLDIGWHPTTAPAAGVPVAGHVSALPGATVTDPPATTVPAVPTATVADLPGGAHGPDVLPASLGVIPPADVGDDPSPGADVTASADATGALQPAAGTTSPREHVVVAGESLWSIAGAHLPGADDAAIAEAWPRWYEANREVVGPDPDLIHPGQVLRVPAAAEEGA